MNGRCFSILACVLLAAAIQQARADEKADALLKEVRETMQAAQTLTADVTMVAKVKGSEMKGQGKVKLNRPNLARMEMITKTPLGSDSRVLTSDGTTLWELSLADNQYQKMSSVDPQGRNLDGFLFLPVGFFAPDTGAFAFSKETRYLGPETVEGKEYAVIEIAIGKPAEETTKLYIGEDKLVHRMTVQMKQGEGSYEYEMVFSNLKTGESLSDQEFAFKPPKTARLYNPEANAIPAGKKAPDFTLPKPNGGTLNLYNTLKGKKAVLVNFWFHG